MAQIFKRYNRVKILNTFIFVPKIFDQVPFQIVLAVLFLLNLSIDFYVYKLAINIYIEKNKLYT